MINKKIVEAFRITPDELDALEFVVDCWQETDGDSPDLDRARATIEKLRAHVLAQ